jgi:hypothetical protein
MPLVDPHDDSVARHVVWHYRYDPQRRERRNVTVAAYDDEAEFVDQLRLLRSKLTDRQLAGEAELVERISGTFEPPGCDAEQRRRRAEWRGRSKARVRRRKGNG